MDELRDAVRRQERERADAGWERPCPFCPDFAGPRAALLAHMASYHGFWPGHPDNIVDAAGLVDLLRSRMDSLTCIFCERRFRTLPVLRKHMRNKRHLRIDPANHEYDRFYLVNYVRTAPEHPDGAGDGAAEEESLVSGSLDDEDEREEDEGDQEDRTWDDWVEDEDDAAQSERARCLVCPLVLGSAAAALEHCASEHGLDVKSECSELSLGFYGRVRFINYARERAAQHACLCCGKQCEETEGAAGGLAEHLSQTGHSQISEYFSGVPKALRPWNDDRYLLPHGGVGDAILQIIGSDEFGGVEDTEEET
eukprot:m51a1_g68 hypothetical protein (310) ;mRNA; f:226441-227474